MMYQKHFRQLTKLVWFQVLFITLIMCAGRAVMFADFVDSAQLAGKSADIWRMVITGLRYDLRVSAISLAPLYLIGLVLAAHPTIWRAFRPVAIGYTTVIAFIVTAITIGNYYYYQTYHNHYDLFAFGLFEDDTQAVVMNMWQDYPIIQSVLLTLGVSLVGALISRRFTQTSTQSKRWPLLVAIVYGLISITVFFVAARGSIGTFPLRQANAQVSEFVVLNKLTPNGFMAIDWAIKARKADTKFVDVSLQEGEALLTSVVGNDELFTQTPKNAYLEQHQPNVVLAVMESLGTNMLAFDDPKTNDMLGSLRQHFQQDFLFERFVSADNGTAPSMAQIMFNSPVQSISQSSAQNLTLAGTAFEPYKQAGYKTIFVSPGNMAWRDYMSYLPKQGVDRVIDQNTLLSQYPESAKYMTDWGLPDDVAFKYVEKLLSEETQPLFIILLSVTNHPPYVTPDYYSPYPTHVSDDYRTRAGQGQISPEGIQTTFQYSADSLGQFISHIKQSSERPTVVAATGDHQMRRISATMPQETLLDKGVPFYLYVPESIQAQLDIRYDANRIGSHKDIMPSLYYVSLSNARYLNVGGRNIVAEQDNPTLAFGVNTKVWLSKDGVVSLEKPRSFYPWPESGLYLHPENKQPVPVELEHKIDDYIKMQQWQLNYRVMQAKQAE
jgi:phosphoglycerol transferase MdoB-like AlkP superfamily enzyme